MKIHLKYKERALCGIRRKKNKLRFAVHEGEATCLRCLKAAST
jgi:hypothetical protein